MSIVHAVGRGVFWNTTSTVVGKFVIFANVFLMLQYLTVYEYGVGQLVLSVVSALGIFMLPGLPSAILADLAAERSRGELGKMKSLFWQFSIASVLFGVIAWALLFFGSNIAAHLYGNDTISNFLKIASFMLLISPLRTIANMLAGVELRYFDQSFYPIFEELMKCIFLIVFLPIMHIGIQGMLLAVVLSQCATLLAYIPRSLSAYATFREAIVQDAFAFWRIIREHRKWSIATSYLGSLSQSIQLWLIKFFLGTEAVGLFSVAQGIYSQVAGFLPLGSILAPLLPRYTNDHAAFTRYVRSAIKAHLFFSVPLLITTFIGIPFLMFVFPKYEPAIPILAVLAFSIFPGSVLLIYTAVFNALKAQHSFFQSMIWKTVFTIVCISIPLWLFGIHGLGLGYVILMLANMLERGARLRRLLPNLTFSLKELFVFDEYERELIRKVLSQWKARIWRTMQR